MSAVSISELKAHLSRYLKQVRRGGEIQILDRGVPVAKLTSTSSPEGKISKRRDRLLRSGLLRAGAGNLAALLETPPVPVAADISLALDDEREDRL